MFPRMPYAQSAAAEWLRGIKWKAILFSICWQYICQFYRAIFRQYVFNWSLLIWRLCWHGRESIHPNIDVSKNAISTICRGWMAAGYQMKGNIVFYLLMKYVLILASRFSAIRLWLNSCERQYCFLSADEILFNFNQPFYGNMSLTENFSFGRCVSYGREYIHPDIDVSKNAICTFCRGWMAVGYQIRGNIVFYLLTRYCSILTSHFR